MRLMWFTITIFVLSTFSGCAIFESAPYPPDKVEYPSGPLPPSVRPTYNLSGYPPATKEGYIDGCETAKKTRYGRKDENRYVTDGQYRMGWDDGFDLCHEK
ncbi:hypothetical protein SAMN05216419_101634 [Nitrosomonas cryotolerans]|uniref:Lipoprotein n=2 Tax=Nitrosomonas cryotolerans TaxID=44575 RepID=A0A1N6HC58_9PROT|nr:hypothetical protein [Nitrosomonas cryotolerans]SFP73847.1 hypothetical protein SAMN05216419_101634 [Nitrosomonas cryotolerans]SIO17343.1 hypothetical protein SAMN02743940_1118 [Nitrosomonas cryotolerans ATCC 49181]